MSVLSAFVVLLVSLALGAVVWYFMRERSVSKLVDILSRWNDDSSDPFRKCDDMTKHIEAIVEQRNRLNKWWWGGSNALDRALVVFQRDVDENVKTPRGLENWLRRKTDAIKNRIGCVRRLNNGKISYHPYAPTSYATVPRSGATEEEQRRA